MNLYRPYYTFRPSFHIGFGLYMGYGVPFPYWYDPYAYAYDGYGYSEGYGSGYSTYTSRGLYGGVSFDITPANANIWVDGVYMGRVNDFSPLQAPLTLRAGLHHIEIAADGLRPLSFDMTVVAGQIIPYQGRLDIN